jgi:hypothetical protein
MTHEFCQWLVRTEAQRDALITYGQSGTSPEGKSLDSITAIKMADEADRLLCEAEKYLTHEKEIAMWETKKNHPDLNSRERELIERSAVREVQMVVDACRITHKSCVSRYFAYRAK